MNTNQIQFFGNDYTGDPTKNYNPDSTAAGLVWNPYDPYPWVRPWRPWIIPDPWVPPRRPRRPVRRPKKKRKAPVKRHQRRSTMNKSGPKETYVTLVLDRSTSMSSCYDAALDSINEQIDTIRENAHKGGKTYVSLILFSDVIDVLFENVRAEEVSPLEKADYRLKGTTALRDAMMTAIDTMEPKFDNEKNQGFLVILISDGQENASGTTKEELQRRIEECEASDAWTFTYMLDGHTWEQVQSMAHDMGVSVGNFATYTSDNIGTRNASKYLSNSSAGYFSGRERGETSSDTFYNDGSGEEVNASTEGSKTK